MNSPKEASLAHLPRSGDKLVDWIFKQFVFFLRKETTHIKRKKRISTARIDPQLTVAGMMCPQDEAGHRVDILINSAKNAHRSRDDELKTLIHELCHLVFWKTWERFIGQMEMIMLEKLTQEQKSYLKSFIPHHEVKSV
jgi:hypothetical protein